MTEANYQQSATCTECDALVGDPIQADFDKYGLVCEVELNKIYDYTAMCGNDYSQTTSAKAVFYNYQVFDYDEGHPAKDGYEWKTVDTTVLYYDENFAGFGWSYAWCYENYYDIIGYDNTSSWDWNGIDHFSVNFNGIDYTECLLFYTDLRNMECDTGESTIRALRTHYLVPIGYDGAVCGLRNKQIDRGEDQHINEIDNTDTLFFRLKNEEDMTEFSATDRAEINLSEDEAMAVIINFYMNMIDYLDEDVIEYFDFDGDTIIDQDESEYLLFWALDNYDTESSIIIGADASIRAAVDYLTGKLDLPDSAYDPFVN